MSHWDGSRWDPGADLPWEAGADEWTTDDEAWRGDTHLRDWPEELAGPEYWLYKRQCEE